MKPTIEEFISQYKGNLTAEQFLTKFVVAVIDCETCEYKLHDDFSNMGECATGYFGNDCNYKLRSNFQEIIKGV